MLKCKKRPNISGLLVTVDRNDYRIEKIRNGTFDSK